MAVISATSKLSPITYYCVFLLPIDVIQTLRRHDLSKSMNKPELYKNTTNEL